MKDCDLIGLKVANDGMGLREALETKYQIKSVKHIGNFVFRAETMTQTYLTIQTKPVELCCRNLRIVSIDEEALGDD